MQQQPGAWPDALVPGLPASLAHQRILILGLGREGVSTYQSLRQRWPDLPLLLADQTPRERLAPEVQALLLADPHAQVSTGPGYLAPLASPERAVDLIFRSPGIRPDLPELEAARNQGVRVTSNTALFFQLCPGRTIGITGTKGKSTTATLIYTILRHSGRPVHLLGNIGVPPLTALAASQPAAHDALFVVELSSYQLADMDQSPQIGVLLQIVPEHLSYHGTFAAYVAAKANIARHQRASDHLVYAAEQPTAAEVARSSPAQKIACGLAGLAGLPADDPCATVAADWLVYRAGGMASAAERIMPMSAVPLPGRFNLQNVLPAVAVARLCGLTPAEIAAGVEQFQPLEHRLELVAELAGVRFYNDSLSTIPEAAIAAIETFAPAPVVLLAGGHERGLDYSGLAAYILTANVRALVLFAPSGERLWQAVEAAAAQAGADGARLPPHFWAEDMPTALRHAWGATSAGDVVLLSPASASFGRFVDYRDRGNQFRAAVRELGQR